MVNDLRHERIQQHAKLAAEVMGTLIHYGVPHDLALVKGYETVLRLMEEWHSDANHGYVVKLSIESFEMAVRLLRSELQSQYPKYQMFDRDGKEM